MNTARGEAGEATHYLWNDCHVRTKSVEVQRVRWDPVVYDRALRVYAPK